MKFLFLLLLAISIGFVSSNAFAEEYPILVSISVDGEPANGGSYDTTISSNGKFVVFMSQASNLVENDRNHQQDIFVRDLINKKTYLVSASSDGTQGSYESGHPSISGDGKKIVFHTGNVFGSDVQNEGGGIYLHDLDSGKTTWISKPVTDIDDDGNELVYRGGSYNPVISDDGKFVFFLADLNDLGLEGTGNLVVYDVNSKILSSLELDVESGYPGFAVSGNGKKIVFSTGDKIDSFPDSDARDVFVYDRDSEKLTWVNPPIDEFKLPSENRRVSIDSEGRYVVFQSSAPNLVEVDDNDDESFFLHDLQTSQTKLISIRPDGTPFFANSWIDISGNGKFVLFGERGMVVYDVELEKTIKLTDDGINSSGIDFDGKFISFISRDNNPQIYVSTNPPPIKIIIEEEEIEEELELIVCEEEICVVDCNTMPNCTVEWIPEPITEPVVEEPKILGIASFVDETKDPQSYVDRYNNEPTYKEWFDDNFAEYDSIYFAVGLEEPMGLASFVDETKDPQSYVDRYNNEPTYKEWFDENYPEYTIYDAVGVKEPTIEFVPEPTKEQTISDVDSEPTCGAGTILKDGICVVDTTKSTEEKSSGGGCLIATATYGSELAPQVQQLRELRDNSLLQTESGTNFMNLFNDFYYSFSPVIADYERENPVFKEAVKITLTPLISSLSILNYVDMDSEVEVLGYGISLILLNVGMYFISPAIVIVGIKRKF